MHAVKYLLPALLFLWPACSGPDVIFEGDVLDSSTDRLIDDTGGADIPAVDLPPAEGEDRCTLPPGAEYACTTESASSYELPWIEDELIRKSIRTNPNNLSVAYSADGTLYLQHYTRTGLDGGDDRVSCHNSNSEYPSITWTGSRIAVAYSDDRSGISRIHYSALDENGKPLGIDTYYNPDDEIRADYPEIGWNGSDLGILWSRSYEYMQSVYMRRIDGDGELIGDKINICGGSILGCSAMGDMIWDGNRWAVAWSMTESSDTKVRFGTVSRSLVPTGERVDVSPGFKKAKWPRIAFNGSHYGIAFLQKDSDEGSYGLAFSSVTLQSEFVAAPTVIPFVGETLPPSIAHDESGFVIAYALEGGSLSNCTNNVVKVDFNGTIFWGPYRLSSTEGDCTMGKRYSDLIWRNGMVYVIYSTLEGLFLQKLTAHGELVGEATIIEGSDTVSGMIAEPEIIEVDLGFAVVWEQNNPKDIYLVVLDEEGRPKGRKQAVVPDSYDFGFPVVADGVEEFLLWSATMDQFRLPYLSSLPARDQDLHCAFPSLWPHGTEGRVIDASCTSEGCLAAFMEKDTADVKLLWQSGDETAETASVDVLNERPDNPAFLTRNIDSVPTDHGIVVAWSTGRNLMAGRIGFDGVLAGTGMIFSGPEDSIISGTQIHRLGEGYMVSWTRCSISLPSCELHVVKIMGNEDGFTVMAAAVIPTGPGNRMIDYDLDAVGSPVFVALHTQDSDGVQWTKVIRLLQASDTAFETELMLELPCHEAEEVILQRFEDNLLIGFHSGPMLEWVPIRCD